MVVEMKVVLTFLGVLLSGLVLCRESLKEFFVERAKYKRTLNADYNDGCGLTASESKGMAITASAGMLKQAKEKLRPGLVATSVISVIAAYAVYKTFS